MDYLPYEVTAAVTWEDRAADRIMELEGLNYSSKAIHQREDYSVRPSGRVTTSYQEPNDSWTKDYGDNSATGPDEYSTELDAEINLKNRLIPEYIDRSRELFPDYDTYSETLRIELLQSVIRGTLKAKHNTVKLINKRDFSLAAVNYLDHAELEASIAGKTDNKGIIPRMQALADALIAEGFK